jgi:hypothetical protein
MCYYHALLQAVKADKSAADVRRAVILGQGRMVQKEIRGLQPGNSIRANSIAVTDAPSQQVTLHCIDSNTILSKVV